MSLSGAPCLKCRAPVGGLHRKYCAACTPHPSAAQKLKQAEVTAEVLRQDNERLRRELVVARNEIVRMRWERRAA